MCYANFCYYKVSDLDIDELVIHIKGAKGKKDRISALPEKLKDNLRNIIAGVTSPKLKNIKSPFS